MRASCVTKTEPRRLHTALASLDRIKKTEKTEKLSLSIKKSGTAADSDSCLWTRLSSPSGRGPPVPTSPSLSPVDSISFYDDSFKQPQSTKSAAADTSSLTEQEPPALLPSAPPTAPPTTPPTARPPLVLATVAECTPLPLQLLEPLNKSSLYINSEPLVIKSPAPSVDIKAQGFRDEYSLADLDTLTDLLQVITLFMLSPYLLFSF